MITAFSQRRELIDRIKADHSLPDHIEYRPGNKRTNNVGVITDCCWKEQFCYKTKKVSFRHCTDLTEWFLKRHDGESTQFVYVTQHHQPELLSPFLNGMGYEVLRVSVTQIKRAKNAASLILAFNPDAIYEAISNLSSQQRNAVVSQFQTEQTVSEFLRKDPAKIPEVLTSLLEDTDLQFPDKSVHTLIELARKLDTKPLQSQFADMVKGLTRDEIIKLATLPTDDVKKLHAKFTCIRLTQFHEFWKANKTNKDEKFWQDEFWKYRDILRLVFNHPYVCIDRESYMGGKGADGRGGSNLDFQFKNQLTDNALLMEIKTPCTQLLVSTEGRNKSFAFHQHTSAAIAQSLNYKHSCQRNHIHTMANTVDEELKYLAADPPVVLVVGNTEQLQNEQQKVAFELNRGALTGLQIMTFDELFQKVGNVINLFEQDDTEQQGQEETTKEINQVALDDLLEELEFDSSDVNLDDLFADDTSSQYETVSFEPYDGDDPPF